MDPPNYLQPDICRGFRKPKYAAKGNWLFRRDYLHHTKSHGILPPALYPRQPGKL